MNNLVTKKIITGERNAVYVRFTKDEFEQIKSEAKDVGLTLPQLLKARAFGKARTTILMSKVVQEKFISELKRVGNNINQIARTFNSGLLAGFYPDFDLIQKDFNRMLCLILENGRETESKKA